MSLLLKRAMRSLSNKPFICEQIAFLQQTPQFNSKPVCQRAIHTSNPTTKPMNPDPRENPASLTLPRETNVGRKRFADFDLAGKTFIVTGGAQGLGLALAESLVEAGGKGMFNEMSMKNC
jgi:hypothetical protein